MRLSSFFLAGALLWCVGCGSALFGSDGRSNFGLDEEGLFIGLVFDETDGVSIWKHGVTAEMVTFQEFERFPGHEAAQALAHPRLSEGAKIADQKPQELTFGGDASKQKALAVEYRKDGATSSLGGIILTEELPSGRGRLITCRFEVVDGSFAISGVLDSVTCLQRMKAVWKVVDRKSKK